MNCNKRIVSLTNIPTPYRAHFFEQLFYELRQREVDFEVFFMAMTEPGRYWSMQPEGWLFPATVDNGVSVSLKRTPIHLNMRLIMQLLHKPPDVILMSGSWFHPTNQLVLWLSKSFAKTKIYFWTESNLEWIRFKSGLIGAWRSLTYKAFSGYILPGKMALDYLSQYVGDSDKPLLLLPNLIDEKLYYSQVKVLRQRRKQIRTKLGISREKRVLFTACRLASIKGVMELLQAMTVLPVDVRAKIQLYVAGEGEQRSSIERFIAENQLVNVTLLGHLEENNILQYYAVSDGFVLPSLGDPYPLVVIEALFAGLPLLLSNHVGCHPEALVQDKNGWLFEPRDSSNFATVLASFVNSSSDKLTSMGNYSQQLAQNTFRTEEIVAKFADQLTACIS